MLNDKPYTTDSNTIHTSYAAPIYLSSSPRIKTRIDSLESVVKIHSNKNISLNRDIHLLRKKVVELQEKIEYLESIKMDRPSVSSELINAERYIDDYFELKNRAEKRQEEYSARIRRKINRINAPNTNSKRRKRRKRKRRISRLITPAIILGTMATILNVLIFC